MKVSTTLCKAVQQSSSVCEFSVSIKTVGEKYPNVLLLPLRVFSMMFLRFLSYFRSHDYTNMAAIIYLDFTDTTHIQCSVHTLSASLIRATTDHVLLELLNVLNTQTGVCYSAHTTMNCWQL